MLRSRLPVRLCLAGLAIGLILVGLHGLASTASAGQPQGNPQGLARAMQVQNRHTEQLLAVPGVVGTATSLDAAGRPVVMVFLERGGVRGVPANLDGVPVLTEVSGRFYALGRPPKPDKNQAPTVTIVSPQDGDSYDSGDSIFFEGSADDYEDGNLSDHIHWYLDVDEDLYEGATFSYQLSDGVHEITAEVTDSGGKTTFASVVISVGVVDPTGRFERPVPIGVSTGHPDITAGTIGCRVKDEIENVYALSNNHIYADCNRASIGDNVLQPGPYDGGIDPRDAIGTLSDYEPIEFSRRANNRIDAAIAQSSVDLLGNTTPAGVFGTPKSMPVSAVLNMNVMKYGRTTGWTHGYVYSTNGTFIINYGPGLQARFVDQIVVSPAGFCAGGDSGSLVVVDGGTANKAPVGLLFAGNANFTICNPIGLVLQRFGVTIDGE